MTTTRQLIIDLDNEQGGLGFLLDEFEDLRDKHGEAFEAWVADDTEYKVNNLAEFTDVYMGEYKSLADFVERFETATGDLGRLAKHINWESVSVDYAADGYYGYYTIDSGHGTEFIFNA